MIARRRHVGPPSRLEHAARRLLGRASRTLVRALIEEGSVTLNGRPASKGTAVRAGDEIRVPILPLLPAEPDLPVGLIDYQDGLVVLDKPAPMPTVPLDPRERGTLAGFVVARWPACRRVGDRHAHGIAHRLDTGTSGLVIVAETQPLWDALREAFATRRVRKHYVALVQHPPPLGPIAAPLGHDRRDGRRMVVAPPGRTWPATTDVTHVEPAGRCWRVALSITTGVTHQVRAHLASVGSPVIGDTLYGGASHPAVAGRHALHATGIEVPPVASHRGGRWSSPPPATWTRLG